MANPVFNNIAGGLGFGLLDAIFPSDGTNIGDPIIAQEFQNASLVQAQKTQNLQNLIIMAAAVAFGFIIYKERRGK